MKVLRRILGVLDLAQILTNVQNNITQLVNGAVLSLSLFFLWLMAIQIVIFSQGWELCQGTASRMEESEAELPATSPVD